MKILSVSVILVKSERRGRGFAGSVFDDTEVKQLYNKKGGRYMKWIQHGFLACFILLSTNAFSNKANIDLSKFKMDPNWKCTIKIKGAFYKKTFYKKTEKYYYLFLENFTFDMTQDKKTDSVSTTKTSESATDFALSDTASIDCKDKGGKGTFSLPKSCQIKIPVNQTISLKGEIYYNSQTKKAALTVASCSK